MYFMHSDTQASQDQSHCFLTAQKKLTYLNYPSQHNCHSSSSEDQAREEQEHNIIASNNKDEQWKSQQTAFISLPGSFIYVYMMAHQALMVMAKEAPHQRALPKPTLPPVTIGTHHHCAHLTSNSNAVPTQHSHII